MTPASISEWKNWAFDEIACPYPVEKPLVGRGGHIQPLFHHYS